MKIKVLGIDPSMSNWGLAFATVDSDTMAIELERLQLVSTKPEDKKVRKAVRQNSMDLRRAQELVGAQLIAQQGRAIAIAEVPVGSQSARAMASYGICIGILASLRIPLIEVTPNEVKLAGAGVKNATKDEMIQWAMKEFPNANWLTRRLHGEVVPTDANEHLADAVGAIKAGVQTQQFRQALAMSGHLLAGTSVIGD